MKVRVGGGIAGHNGLRSIDARLGPDSAGCGSASGIPGPGARTSTPPTRSAIMPRRRWNPVSDVLAAIAAEAEWLADGDDARFMSDVAL